MEAIVALAGAILILLSFGGVAFESRILATKEPVPPGDRIAALLVGGSLIATAAIVEFERFSRALWVALGLIAAAVLGYSIFLFWTRPKPPQEPPPD